ncbi:MAG: hypothetical protein RLZZ387_66 [Chloroflexota bacterium]
MLRPALFLLALLLTLGASPAQAQSTQRCFAETGYCTAGRIREFWEQSGGLPVFGYPITPLQTETIEGRQVQVQWFERGRLELHPQNRRPYDVQLGRLGADLLARGRTASATAPVQEVPGACRTFAETGIAACGPILTAWRASGLELDGRPGKTEAESLALFGLPLTAPRTEVLSDGRAYTVQWFERGRFEIHPEGVLLGLLGREYGPTVQAAPAPVAQSLSAPARIMSATIGMDAPIVNVGLDAARAPVVPDHEVGWYNRSAVPGGGENIVLWGHVLRFSHALHIPAPFARLKELEVGDRLTVVDVAGGAHEYVVARKVMAKPDEVQYILPQGRELVTLVSCYGDKVYSGGEVVDMSHRLITIAEPAR